MKSLLKALSFFESQVHMAKKLGITTVYLNYILRGKKFPSLKLALTIEEKTNGNVKALDIMQEVHEKKIEMIRASPKKDD